MLGKKIELIHRGKIKAVRARALGISPKNIYHERRQESKDQALAQEIKEVHKTDPAYGHRRVALKLGINHKRALRVMSKFKIKPPRRKIKKFYCTKSTYAHSYTNLIKQLEPRQPDIIWASDVSYIKFQGRFYYLATIEDLATREIITAQVSKKHDSLLIKHTIKQALATGRKPQYFHTDQGTEFMAEICTDLLEFNGIKVSVSATASPWENGFKESFFGRFKNEFGDFNRFEHIGQLIEEIYSQIHYYNYQRIHTSLKMPPKKYAQTLRKLS
ncbi:MAG: IS3 family transposase [Candidatus Pacebacteria bacterium]|nr:IS3 family transposase [Candidatus Paceibacterota bacterium]